MKKETYIQMTGFFRNQPSRAKAATLCNKAITTSIYIAYPCLLIWIFVTENGLVNPLEAFTTTHFLKAFCVPFVSFILLSIFRDKLNAPRPYEVFNIPPVIKKDTRGHSFPSRHVFSISVIGVTFLACATSPIWGIIVLCMTVLLAFLRVVTGVHWPKDVLAGMLIGILCGCIEFFI